MQKLILTPALLPVLKLDENYRSAWRPITWSAPSFAGNYNYGGIGFITHVDLASDRPVVGYESVSGDDLSFAFVESFCGVKCLAYSDGDRYVSFVPDTLQGWQARVLSALLDGNLEGLSEAQLSAVENFRIVIASEWSDYEKQPEHWWWIGLKDAEAFPASPAAGFVYCCIAACKENLMHPSDCTMTLLFATAEERALMERSIKRRIWEEEDLRNAKLRSNQSLL